MEAVVAPAGDARPEWDFVDDLTRRLACTVPAFAILAIIRKAMGIFGIVLSPRIMMDAPIRMSQGGDRFGVRPGGLTLRRPTKKHSHGIVVAQHIRTGVLRNAIAYLSWRVKLTHSDIADEVDKLANRHQPDDYPLKMIGLREPRSENSWMHNSPLLMRGDRAHRALIHVEDAEKLAIADGDDVRVSSPYGAITVGVSTTKDLMAGVIAVPHGWGAKEPGPGRWPTGRVPRT